MNLQSSHMQTRTLVVKTEQVGAEVDESLLSIEHEVSTPGVGWSWGSTLTPNYGGLGGGGLELSNSATS